MSMRVVNQPMSESDQISSGPSLKIKVCDSKTPSREFVLYALQIGALELIPEGRKLKSGRISPYFFNSGLFDTGDSLSRLASAYAAAVYREGRRPEVIFGPAYKGIPLVAAVAVTLGNSIGYAFNRKEEKDHGEGGTIVGMSSLKGKTVTILDDVMTTGASIIEAAEIIRKNGGTPIGCVIAFDREERVDGELSAVQKFRQKYQIPVQAAATLDDLIWALEMLNKHEDLERVLAYKAEYGVYVF